MNNNFEITVLKELGDIKALCATNKAHNEALEKRIESLENTNKRQWWLHGIQGIVVMAFGIWKKVSG